MLTRLEVDGFKNLLRFEVDFGPFNCIAGPNGVGKSNIFDAIRFLSLLANNTITDAALSVRGNAEMADERDLLWTNGKQRAASFRIAAEMIVQPKVFDDVGREVTVTSTYLRYEVEIGYEEADLERRHLGGLFLLSETLHDYTAEEAKERLPFPHSDEFFEAVVHHKKEARQNFISTQKGTNGQPQLIVHPNGTGLASPQVVPTRTPRTVVATAGMWVSPMILAAQREMQSFKILAMEPRAMRVSDALRADPHLTTYGGHLHATLYRMATTAATYGRTPEDVYASVAVRLSELVPAWDLSVDVDPIRRLLTTEVLEQRFNGYKIPARSLSDGALRFLTLSVLNEDPEFQSLLCLEEPENGIHPSVISRLVELLKEMTVDPTFREGSFDWEEGNPMRQVIIATHSPYLVQLQEPNDLLIVVQPMVRGPKGQPTNTLRCLPLSESWRHSKNGRRVDWVSVLDYLVAPPEALVKLPAALFEN